MLHRRTNAYVQFLSHYIGEPVDYIYSPPDKAMTWLRSPEGKPRFMDFSDYPVLWIISAFFIPLQYYESFSLGGMGDGWRNRYSNLIALAFAIVLASGYLRNREG